MDFIWTVRLVKVVIQRQFKISEKANIIAIDQDSDAKILLKNIKEFKNNFFFFNNSVK